MVKMMTTQIQAAVDIFNQHLSSMAGNTPQQQQQQQPTPRPQTSPTPGIPSVMQPRMQTQPNGGVVMPPQVPPVVKTQTPSSSHPAPPARNTTKRTPGNNASSTPTPPQSAPTPTSNNVIPATSPPTTSPKTKPKPKPAPRRKPSVQKATVNANVPTPSPVMENTSVSTPAAAATPASNQAPTPGSDPSTKRKWEEEEPAPVQTPPSPKRTKASSEWENTPSEAQVKRNEQVEKIKTGEDASKFLEEFTELIKQASGVEGQASMASDISDTLDQILKSYTVGNDFAPASEMSESSGLATAGEHRQPSPSPTGGVAAKDEFGDYFDFSSFAEDDSGSKAPTPDLVVTSTTNPSPESASDPGGTPFTTDIASGDDSTAGDMRRLGIWKEIDGGEGAFYQQDNWKWDTPMPTLDQPWAIFQS
jgi:hypothetical protein